MQRPRTSGKEVCEGPAGVQESHGGLRETGKDSKKNREHSHRTQQPTARTARRVTSGVQGAQLQGLPASPRHSPSRPRCTSGLLRPQGAREPGSQEGATAPTQGTTRHRGLRSHQQVQCSQSAVDTATIRRVSGAPGGAAGVEGPADQTGDGLSRCSAEGHFREL